jgi:hypothetical protein
MERSDGAKMDRPFSSADWQDLVDQAASSVLVAAAVDFKVQ